MITFALYRVGSFEGDQWILHNIWNLFPDAPVILIGNREIFSEEDQDYHVISPANNFATAFKKFSENPTDHLIFLRSSVIIMEKFEEEVLRLFGDLITFGDWNKLGLCGFNDFAGRLKCTNWTQPFDYLKGEIKDENLLEFAKVGFSDVSEKEFGTLDKFFQYGTMDSFGISNNNGPNFTWSRFYVQ